MDTVPTPALDLENDPWRRGIERPNAKRLSISLGPLVAQRSLLFRIKADLAGAGAGAGPSLGSYEELEESEDSPLDSTRLYSLTPGASGRIFSSESIASLINASQAAAFLPPQNSIDLLLSPSSSISTASIYSQASWNPTSPSIASSKPRDRRRQAMAFSPSLRWDGIPSSASRLPASLMSASVSLGQKPTINSPSDSLLTRKTLLVTPQLPPTPLSPLLKMEVLESSTNADEVVGSVRLAKASPTPLVVVRRRVYPAEDDGKWRPQRQPSISSPSVIEERALVDQSTIGVAAYPSPPDEECTTRLLEKKPSQDETDESKRHTKRVTKFGRVMSRFSVANSKKDNRVSKNGKKRMVGSGVVNPAEAELVLLPEVEVSPTDLSFSDSLVPDRPAPVSVSTSSLSQTQDIAPRPLSVSARSARTSYRTPLPPMTQPLPSLPPLPTPTHFRPLLPVHEAPPSTPARTPFIAEFDEEDLVALQGQRAQATRVHRRSRSSSAVLRTPGLQDIQTHPLPVNPPQVRPIRHSRPPGSTTSAPQVLNETSSRKRSSMRPPPPPPRPPRAWRPPSTTATVISGFHNPNESVSLPMPSLHSNSAAGLPVEQRFQPTPTNMLPSPPRPRNHSLSILTTKTADGPMRRRPRVPSAAEPLAPERR